MFDPILELHAKLQRNKEKRTAAIEDKAIARTAAVKDLLKLGSSTSEISQLLKLHPHLVDIEVSRIEAEAKERRRFLATGQISKGDGGYFAILQK